MKTGCKIEPLIRGGHQENGFRAGTYNAPSIAAYGKAAELAKADIEHYTTHTKALREKLKNGLLEKIPNIKINGHPEKVLPNTLDISFPGAEGEAILLHLDLLGVDVSTGSACASGSLEPSHVLMATGLGPELAHGSIRFSFGKYNTESFYKQSPQDHFSIWNPKIAKKILKKYGFKTVKVVSTGIHPERYPFVKKHNVQKGTFVFKLFELYSKLFSLGDTFEIYAIKK